MYIDVIGQGLDLVLIYGWVLQGGVFVLLVQCLVDWFILYLVDFLGYGYSCEDIMLLCLLFVVNVIVVVMLLVVWCGWLLGGLFVLYVVVIFLKVCGLVMIVVMLCFVWGDDWLYVVELVVFEQFGCELEIDFGGILECFLVLDVMGFVYVCEELWMLC